MKLSPSASGLKGMRSRPAKASGFTAKMITSMIARAKLNLALHVTGQKPESGLQAGYHTLHSLVAFANFGDEVCVARSEQDRLTVNGPFSAEVPALSGNTLGRALAMVRGWGKDALASGPVSINLTKNVPVASGIGGGSADAAALIALLTEGRVLNAPQSADVLTLGADVPMCLDGRSAVIAGIGEEIAPVALPDSAVVLVNPGAAVETPSVFRVLSEKTNPQLPRWSEPGNFSALIDYLQKTRNDLMNPAISIVPAIQECLDALSGAPFSRMSGSGATCFALCATAEEAEHLAAETHNAHPDWWVQVGFLS